MSNSTKDDLINIFSIPESKISVIHSALDERFVFTQSREDSNRLLERYQLKDPFVLYSGKIRPHKKPSSTVKTQGKSSQPSEKNGAKTGLVGIDRRRARAYFGNGLKGGSR